VVLDLVAKDIVESIFEKRREAALLGFTLGMLLASFTAPHKTWLPMVHVHIRERA